MGFGHLSSRFGGGGGGGQVNNFELGPCGDGSMLHLDLNLPVPKALAISTRLPPTQFDDCGG